MAAPVSRCDETRQWHSEIKLTPDDSLRDIGKSTASMASFLNPVFILFDEYKEEEFMR